METYIVIHSLDKQVTAKILAFLATDVDILKAKYGVTADLKTYVAKLFNIEFVDKDYLLQLVQHQCDIDRVDTTTLEMSDVLTDSINGNNIDMGTNQQLITAIDNKDEESEEDGDSSQLTPYPTRKRKNKLARYVSTSEDDDEEGVKRQKMVDMEVSRKEDGDKSDDTKSRPSKRFECQKCLKQFTLTQYRNGEDHAAQHTNFDVYKCSVEGCGFTAKCIGTTHTHVRNHHRNIPFKVMRVEFNVEKAKELRQVVKECFPTLGMGNLVTCQLCHRTVSCGPIGSGKSCHVNSHMDFMLYKCNEKECEFETKNVGMMKLHGKKEHQKNSNVKGMRIKLTREQELMKMEMMKICFPECDIDRVETTTLQMSDGLTVNGNNIDMGTDQQLTTIKDEGNLVSASSISRKRGDNTVVKKRQSIVESTSPPIVDNDDRHGVKQERRNDEYIDETSQENNMDMPVTSSSKDRVETDDVSIDQNNDNDLDEVGDMTLYETRKRRNKLARYVSTSEDDDEEGVKRQKMVDRNLSRKNMEDDVDSDDTEEDEGTIKENKRHECKKCCKMILLGRYSHAERHAFSHTSLKQFECTVEGCRYKANGASTMRTHHKKVHKRIPYCLKRKELSAEKAAKLQEVIKECFPNWKMKDLVSCQLCHREVSTYNSVRGKVLHAIFHLDFMLYKCQECEFETKNVGLMRTHGSKMHGKKIDVKDTKIELTDEQELAKMDMMNICFPEVESTTLEMSDDLTDSIDGNNIDMGTGQQLTTIKDERNLVSASSISRKRGDNGSLDTPTSPPIVDNEEVKQEDIDDRYILDIPENKIDTSLDHSLLKDIQRSETDKTNNVSIDQANKEDDNVTQTPYPMRKRRNKLVRYVSTSEDDEEEGVKRQKMVDMEVSRKEDGDESDDTEEVESEGNERYECQKCSKMILSRRYHYGESHAAYHTNFDLYECSIEGCGYTGKNAHNVRAHHKSYHRTVPFKVKKVELSMIQINELHEVVKECFPNLERKNLATCQLCHRSVCCGISDSGKLCHVISHLDFMLYKCQECEFETKNVGAMKNHGKVHKKNINVKDMKIKLTDEQELAKIEMMKKCFPE